MRQHLSTVAGRGGADGKEDNLDRLTEAFATV
jgi:hypothetical protein